MKKSLWGIWGLMMCLSVLFGIHMLQNGEEKLTVKEYQVENNVCLSSRGNIVVVLDPGHDSTHSGTNKGGLNEATLNLKIAQYCKAELENYAGVTVYMTRNSSSCPYPGTSSVDDNANRVAYAQSVGADYFVSIHCNSSSSSSISGATVYYPNGNYNSGIGNIGGSLASKILRQLTSLGLSDNGTLIRNSEDNTLYPDGSLSDYYGVIRRSKLDGITAVIIEHAYQSNSSDVANFLNSDSKLQGLGIADATAIAEHLGISQSATVYNGVDYSAVFDKDYYATQYPDLVAALGNNTRVLLKHFVNYGMKEGRQGIANFNVYSYKSQYVDLRNAYGNDLSAYYLHYIKYGQSEGRQGIGCTSRQGKVTCYNGVDYSAVYDYDYYSTNNEDINAAFGMDDVSTLAHFVNCGMREKRQAIATFNVNSYRNQYADLRRAFGNTSQLYYLHYINCGMCEGRQTTGCTSLQGAVTVYNGIDYSAVYDYNYYIAHNTDVANAYGADDASVLAHFVNCGMNEGRQAISTFNVYSYKNQYVDLRETFGTDLKSYYLHYVNCGNYEGRTGTGCSSLQGYVTTYEGIDYSSVYDYNYYLAHNKDVKIAYGNDDIAVLKHFVLCGMREGRQAISTFNVQIYQSRYNDLQTAFGTDLQRYYIHYMNCGKKENRLAI